MVSVESVITTAVGNPQATGVGLLAGFLLAKALAWRKKRKNNLFS